MKTLDLGEAVGPGVPTGGTANQLLVKNGSTNFDTSWKTADQLPAIANVQDGLAIVANGNTHAAIASGQFVYVKNHGSLAEGLYRATAAIGTNATLSTSNLTADSAGGLNALKADVDSLNSKIAQKTGSLTSFGGYTTTSNLNIRQVGNIIIINGYVELLSIDANQDIYIGTISGVSYPSESIRTICGLASAGYEPPTSIAYCVITTSGQLRIKASASGARAMYVNVTYCVA